VEVEVVVHLLKTALMVVPVVVLQLVLVEHLVQSV
jgi:hypothetical protein